MLSRNLEKAKQAVDQYVKSLAYGGPDAAAACGIGLLISRIV